ncbi:hypothetical protein II906_02815 [bacterium]|nr:hypothetical protein [bacterium]
MNVSSVMLKVKSAAPKVAKGIKKFAGTPLAVASKAIGAACVAGVLYDSHVNAREKAIVKDENDTANRLYSQHKMSIMSGKESAVLCNLKRRYFDVQQAYPFYHINSKTQGYISGFSKTIVKDAPILALSAIAIFCNSKSKVLGPVGKIAGVALAAIAARQVSSDVLGYGLPDTKLK